MQDGPREIGGDIMKKKGLFAWGLTLVLSAAISGAAEMPSGLFQIQWGLYNDGHNEPISLEKLSGELQSPRADVHYLEAMKIFKPKRKARIVLIDTGLDIDHPDLKGCLWTNQAEAAGQPGVDDDHNGYVDDLHGYSFIDKEGSVPDFEGHGTMVAGIVCSKPYNEKGLTGILPEADIVVAKVIGSRWADGLIPVSDAIVQAMDYAIAVDADVVSMSMGTPDFDQQVFEAVKRLEVKNIPLVVAANNVSSTNQNQDDYPDYPAHFDVENVIVVTAHDARNLLARWAAYGPRTVDIAAPGVNIVTTNVGGGHGRTMTATSLAAPFVTGALGLLIAQEGRMSLADLKDRLFATSTPVPDVYQKIVSGGRLNIENLLLNRRIPRLAYPAESQWQTWKLSESVHFVEGEHETRAFQKTFQIPEAKWIRAVIQYASSSVFSYFFFVRDPNTLEIAQSFSGEQQMVKTVPLQGNSLEIIFPNDTKNWSLTIDSLEYVK